jgi:uncharacterized membrane protein YkoI
MKKLTGKVKWIMVALLAVVTAGASVALKARAQGEGQKRDEQVKYRSTIQVQDDKNEREEANDSEGAENKEENEGSEANEANESKKDGEEAEDRAEGAESERLKGLARITPEQAQAAAVAQVPGTVKKVELENEDGNLVYGVEIKTANGESDVKVDAGDGRVLHVEKDGEED